VSTAIAVLKKRACPKSFALAATAATSGSGAVSLIRDPAALDGLLNGGEFPFPAWREG
jgi:hypothetical protein